MKRGAIIHPKIASLMRRLTIPRAHAVGMMEMIYHWAGDYAPRGDVGRFTDDEIAAAVEWSGDAPALIDALVTARLFDASRRHRLIIHDWSEHAADYIHMRLARAGMRFADGSLPKTSRLPAEDKIKADNAFARKGRNKNRVHGVTTENTPPNPPSPSPSAPLPTPPNPAAVDPVRRGGSGEKACAAGGNARAGGNLGREFAATGDILERQALLSKHIRDAGAVGRLIQRRDLPLAKIQRIIANIERDPKVDDVGAVLLSRLECAA